MTVEKKKPMEDDPIFKLMQSIQCQLCMDTNVEIMLHGPDRCSNCASEKKTWSNAAQQLQVCVRELTEKQSRSEKPKPIDKQTLTLARVLTHFSVAAPLQLKFITHYWGVDSRLAKRMLATLREDWLLPIGSLRQPPYGTYWVDTPEDFRAWSRSYRGQGITQLATAYRLQRRWYPLLYGQTELEFLQLVTDELKEAL
jgi:hypothetical protein